MTFYSCSTGNDNGLPNGLHYAQISIIWFINQVFLIMFGAELCRKVDLDGQSWDPLLYMLNLLLIIIIIIIIII